MQNYNYFVVFRNLFLFWYSICTIINISFNKLVNQYRSIYLFKHAVGSFYFVCHMMNQSNNS